MPLFKPNLLNIPCEHTVEVMSNHYLLHHLNVGSAWLYCPTPPAENTLGYDASLQNGKILIIQYKAVKRVNKDGSLVVEIDSTQQDTLRDNFPKGSAPYVFYAFSLYPNYGDLDGDYLSVGAPHFFGKMLFVDVWSLPKDCKTLKVTPPDKLTVMGKTPSIKWLNGYKLVCGLIQCDVGIKTDEYSKLVKKKTDTKITKQSFFGLGSTPIPYMAILLWRPK